MGDMQETVIIIEDFFDDKEIEFLISDIELFSYAFQHFRDDLGDYGSSLDPFEMLSIAPGSPIRTSKAEYLTARWKYIEDKLNIKIDDEYKDQFSNIVFEKIPKSLRQLVPHQEQTLYLFNEQYIVKDPGSQIAFRWHTDENEQLIAIPSSLRQHYFSVWCNLDAVSKSNGTISFRQNVHLHILKYPVCSTESPINIEQLFKSDLIEPDENEVGCELVLNKGCVVLFASNVWHRSGINEQDSTRRVLYAQYSLRPITISLGSSDGDAPLAYSVPC